MNNPFVSIILVNWNGLQYIKDCLKSLQKTTYKRYEIIFVDNDSTDGSVAYVLGHYKNIKIVQNQTNRGFAGGHDAALKIAKGKAILLLNIDTYVDAKFLETLVCRLYSHPTIGVVGPKVLLSDDTHKIDSIGAFYLTNGLLYHYGREKDERLPIYNRPMEIFTTKGVCMLIKKEVIEKIGLFDPEYFAYFEETDFCMRTWMAGWRIVYEPEARIYHKGGHASSRLPSAIIQYHAFKNVFATYLKNLSFVYLIPALLGLLSIYGAGSIFYLLKGNGSVMVAFFRGIWWNIIHAPEIFKKRQRLFQLRTVSDRDYLSHLTYSVKIQYYYHQFFGGLGQYHDIPILQER